MIEKYTKIIVQIFMILLSVCFYGKAQEVVALKTSGKLPQMAWSNGIDRLGSAKMGYIDTGILLQVADTTGNVYKIKLAQNRHAYLDKSGGTIVANSPLPAIVTMESWRIKGGEQADSLTISLGRKVAYQSWMETNPARIVVQLYGVQANTNWITQLQSAREITRADYRQVEDDVVELTIYLKHKQHYGYQINYRGNQMLLTVRVSPRKQILKGKVIVVDAGHGGTNSGARGINSGIMEKDYTLLFAKALEKVLTQKEAIVLMVRSNDTTIDNKDRVLWAMSQNPDLFISLHLNSSGRETARGTSTYYKHLAYQPLAKNILQEMLQIDGLAEFGLIGSFNFQPVQPTQFPSCLVEIAFLSNREDEKRIMDPDFHRQVAQKIAAGVANWYKYNRRQPLEED